MLFRSDDALTHVLAVRVRYCRSASKVLMWLKQENKAIRPMTRLAAGWSQPQPIDLVADGIEMVIAGPGLQQALP